MLVIYCVRERWKYSFSKLLGSFTLYCAFLLLRQYQQMSILQTLNSKSRVALSLQNILPKLASWIPSTWFVYVHRHSKTFATDCKRPWQPDQLDGYAHVICTIFHVHCSAPTLFGIASRGYSPRLYAPLAQHCPLSFGMQIIVCVRERWMKWPPQFNEFRRVSRLTLIRW